MLILASKSPRRIELLGLTGLDFSVIPSECDEKVDKSLPPNEVVELLARQKAEDVAAKHKDATVIGSDTIVYCDDEILGKPSDNADAFRMLKLLSGRKHYVYTGVCIIGAATVIFSEKTEVEFYELSDDEINAYIATGEPSDKAGAYGIQEKGALLIKGIVGDYYNVMGLPVAALNRRLKAIL